jgi:outer membrane protein
MTRTNIVRVLRLLMAVSLYLAANPEKVHAFSLSSTNPETVSSQDTFGSSASSSATEADKTQIIDEESASGDSMANTPLPLPAGSRLTLKDAISIALKYHPRAAEAAAESEAAQQQVGAARSYLGPQVSSVSEYLRSTNNGIANTTYYNPDGLLPRITGTNHNLPSDDTSQSWESSNSYLGGVGASQYLFDFGRRRGFVRERRFEAAEADQQQRLVSLDLVLEVSQRYFDLLRAKQLVRVFEKAVEERQFHLHAAEIKAKAGLRPQLDVYVTQAEVQRARLHLVDAQNSKSDCVVALDNALGLGGRSPSYQLTDVLSYSNVTDSMVVLLRTAFHLRPDFASLRDQAQAMGAQVAEYRSDYFPTAEAVGGYSAMGTGLPAANNFNVGIVITWPIFNSFLTSHQVAAAKFRQRAVQSQIEDLRQRIVLQVKTAFLDWQASLQRINRAAQTRAASQAELELAEKRYNAGLTDIVELEDAQRNYTDDDAAYANALYGYSIAKANADYATGRSLSD